MCIAVGAGAVGEVDLTALGSPVSFAAGRQGGEMHARVCRHLYLAAAAFENVTCLPGFLAAVIERHWNTVAQRTPSALPPACRRFPGDSMGFRSSATRDQLVLLTGSRRPGAGPQDVRGRSNEGASAC